ncbi:hypothetical protein ACFQH3_12150 [Haladaptatus sp. GCM10025707]|uniref:hypothetical protein n=1 Tax=unclassified Haladaptatus TaxID=2622732 RepID=UPI0023E8D24E|nr:hypothetical protein [Haladaptatus sp. QDMS2]
MLVVDTSAFVSLAVGDVIDIVLDEFDVMTTETVFDELGQTADYDDRHGAGAATVIDARARIDIVEKTGEAFETSRIDAGEASCLAVVREEDAPFLVTDDFRALPELQQLVDADVVLSPIVLRALVKRSVLTGDEAKEAFESIATGRDWLGTPIYRYARTLLE